MTEQQNKKESAGQEQLPNEGLSGLVAQYWEEKESPGYRGYKASSGMEHLKEEVHDHASDQQRETNRDSFSGKRKHNKKRNNKRTDRKRMSRPAKMFCGLGTVLIAIVVIAAASFFILEYKGKRSLTASAITDENITGAEDAQVGDGGKTVVYNGETYCYNDNISTILCIGVDREEYNDSGTYGEGGQADTLFLVAVDNESGKSTMIPISRNTMVTIDEYNEDGTYWRQNEIQIALAYTYGDGREKSCENVAQAVSRLMYGMPVNDYVALDLSAIASLNDAVGGVPVNVLEDMTEYDPVLIEGTQVTLKGQQAVSYVRSRKVEGYDLEVDNNAARMERQKQYMSAFLKTMIRQTKEDLFVPLNLYNMAKEDMITSVTASEVMYYAQLIVNKGLDNSIVSIPGKAKKGEYTEVYVDDETLYQIILDTFYKKMH